MCTSYFWCVGSFSWLTPYLFLFWFVSCFHSVFISLSVLVGCACIFPMPKKVRVLVLVSGVLFWLFIGISGLLWGFCSKNLIGPVRSGKPLGLFSVTRPYARFWHLMRLMGRQAPLNLSMAWVLACTSVLMVWHGEFRKNFDSFGEGKCILVSCTVLVGRRFCDRYDQQGLPPPITIGNR